LLYLFNRITEGSAAPRIRKSRESISGSGRFWMQGIYCRDYIRMTKKEDMGITNTLLSFHYNLGIYENQKITLYILMKSA
jgi:hypothetical protein